VVRVLVLIDEHVAKALLPALEDFRAPLPEPDRLGHQIVEVEGTEAPERRAVLRPDDPRDLVVLVALALGQVVSFPEVRLRLRDAREDRRDVVPTLGADAAQDLADRAGRVAFVEDRELAVAKAERAGFGREHAKPEAVERRDDELLGELFAGKLHHALFHLFGGLVREGDGEDRTGEHATREQPSDASGDDARLAGPGSGQDEQRARVVFHGFALRGVQRRHIVGVSRSFARVES
jgi:hypothetical protein